MLMTRCMKELNLLQSIDILLQAFISGDALLPDSIDFGLLNSLNEGNWADLINFSVRQNVAASALRGFEIISKNAGNIGFSISKETLRQWYGISAEVKKNHVQMSMAVHGLISFFKEKDMKMMLLKGIGLGQEYPDPSCRYSSDIDIYLFGEGDKADKLLMEEHNLSVQNDIDKHSKFMVNGFAVENHKTFLNTAKVPVLAALESRLEDIADKCIDYNGLYLPSVKFNTLFLTVHMMLHFVFGGFNMSHILDWACFTKNHSSQIDWDELIRYASDAGFLRFVGVINSLASEMSAGVQIEFPHIEFNAADKQLVTDAISACELKDQKNRSNSPALLNSLCHYLHLRKRYKFAINDSYLKLLARRGRKSF